MPAGRPAKPLKVHQFEGTFRADRHVKANVGGGKVPPMPRGLDATARAAWRRLVATRSDWLAESDADAMRQLCVLTSLCAKAEKLVLAKPTDKEARCAFVAYQHAWKSLAACFGMTPTDRAKL